MTDSFYSGIDSHHIPLMSVAPMELTNYPYLDSMTTGYDLESQSASSAASAKSCISPSMVEAEMMNADLHFQSPIEHFGSYPDRWINTTMPPTPPEDYELDLFSVDKNDPMDLPSYTESVTECEFLGPSRVQFHRSLHSPAGLGDSC